MERCSGSSQLNYLIKGSKVLLPFILSKSGCLKPSLGFLIILITFGQAQAQWKIKISSGVNQNFLKNNLSNQDFVDNKSRIGIQGTLSIQRDIKSWIALESGLCYIQKNYSIERTGFFTGINTKVTNTYLQVPISLKFNVLTHSRVSGYFSAGMYGAIWMRGDINAELPNVLAPKEYDPSYSYNNFFELVSKQTISSRYVFNSEKDRRYEAGILLGVGINFKLNDKYSLNTQFQSQHSLIDQQKKYQLNQIEKKNNTYVLEVGVIFKLNL